MLPAKPRRDWAFLAYRKGGVTGEGDACLGSLRQGAERAEQSFAEGPRAGQVDGRSQLCFLAKGIFLWAREGEVPATSSLVAGHGAARMCLQLSLPLGQAPQDRNSPSPEPGGCCCLLHVNLAGSVFSQGCDASSSPCRIAFLSCNIRHLASKRHKRYQGRYLC